MHFRSVFFFFFFKLAWNEIKTCYDSIVCLVIWSTPSPREPGLSYERAACSHDQLVKCGSLVVWPYALNYDAVNTTLFPDATSSGMCHLN